MSNIAVRNALVAAWPILTPNLPYVPTINQIVADQDTDVPIWGTFIFDTSTRVHDTMGSRPWIEEQGIAIVALLSYSGVTDQDIAQAASDVVKAWEMWHNSDGSIWIHSVDGPSVPDPEAVGDVYRLTVTLNYRYQTRGGP
jgi:hypothetical protein